MVRCISNDESESKIQSEIRLAASRAGFILWRNNTGTGWVGNAIPIPDNSVLIKNARVFHAGLCQGASDLIGFRGILIGPEHVGSTIAQFVACEVKSASGRPTKEQVNFLRVVSEAGGLAVVARGVEDLLNAVD